MSFGFSIGDIVMLTQLAYDLYTVLSSGRESAPATLRELAKSLFGLQCTLGHLKDLLLSGKFSSSATPPMQQNLSLQIENCGDTLKQLNAILKVYEEKVVVRGKGTRGKVVREWNRVKWAVEEKGLVDIRAKIMQQTDGITLFLNIIIWYEVRDGRNEAREGTAKIEESLDKLFRHGADAKQTAQDAEQMMKDLKDMVASLVLHPPPPPRPPSPPPPPPPRPPLPRRPPSLPRDRGFVALEMQLGPPKDKRTLPAKGGFVMTGIEDINRQRAGTAKRRPITLGPPAADPPPPPGPSDPSMAAALLRQPIPALSPSEWLAKCEAMVQLWAATPASTANETTKTRTSAAVGLLHELNACLVGIRSKEERRRYRARLEGERFDLALRQMKVFCKGSVMLRKEVEVYEDDKEDDETG